MRDTIDMAREAGFEAMRGHGLLPHVPEDIFIANVRVTEQLKAFEALVRADEREQAAAQPAPADTDLMACWVEKSDGTIDGIASMRLALSKYGTASEGTEERVLAICKAIEAKLKEKNT